MPPRTATPLISLRHILWMTDDRGLLEHAEGTVQRFSNGYCTDDNARLLIVATRDEGRSLGSNELSQIAMQFLIDAQQEDGTVRNRMSYERIWLDNASTEDCWGRSLWAFGTVAARKSAVVTPEAGLHAFERGAHHRPTSLRSMCFAALGAAEILRSFPDHLGATSLLKDAADSICFDTSTDSWPWPEARLSYANAVVPQTMIEAGWLLHDKHMLARGIKLLHWLIETETFCDQFSVTPANGRSLGDPKPAFDQQPIELAAIADACASAFLATGDPHWNNSVSLAIDWFLGRNDAEMPMIDFETHGGFDGLLPAVVNINQGAESTLAMISTLQYASLDNLNGVT